MKFGTNSFSASRSDGTVPTMTSCAMLCFPDVCTYECVVICMYACTYCMYVCMYVCMRVMCVCVCVCVCVYVCVCMCVCLCVKLHAHACQGTWRERKKALQWISLSFLSLNPEREGETLHGSRGTGQASCDKVF